MKIVARLFFLFFLATSVNAEPSAITQPKTCDEAVKMLLGIIAEDDLLEIRNTAANDLIMYHFGLGTMIRNEFGLWNDNPSLIIDCNNAFPGKLQPWHPDTVSMIIIEHLWKHLNTTP